MTKTRMGHRTKEAEERAEELIENAEKDLETARKALDRLKETGKVSEAASALNDELSAAYGPGGEGGVPGNDPVWSERMEDLLDELLDGEEEEDESEEDENENENESQP